MKARLPKMLLAAIVASSLYTPAMAAATQGAFCVTSDNVIDVWNGTSELTPAQKEVLTQPLIEGSANATPYPVVKDGEGELVISNTTGNLEITNPLVVREGTLTVDGVSIDSKSPFSNFVPYLSVGGQNATLKLDNGATISHKLGNTSPSNYCGSMSLGTADGAANVVLDHGSTLHTDHFIIAGDPDGNGSSYGGAGTGHTKYTYENSDSLTGIAVQIVSGTPGMSIVFGEQITKTIYRATLTFGSSTSHSAIFRVTEMNLIDGSHEIKGSVGFSNISVLQDNAFLAFVGVNQAAADVMIDQFDLALSIPDGETGAYAGSGQLSVAGRYWMSGADSEGIVLNEGPRDIAFEGTGTVQEAALRYSGGGEGPTTIDVLGGSTLSAGTSLQFADVTVNIKGDGSRMEDNTRNLAITTPDCGSYFGYERSSFEGVTTEINITEGGAYICNWNLSTGGYVRMDEVTDENRNCVSILVSGKDAGTGAASSISVAGHMALGGNLCPGETPDTDSHTTLTVENGGVAYLNVVTIGGEGYGKAEMTVGEGSYVCKHTAPKYADSITGPFTEPVIIVGDNGSLTNAGTIEIDTVLNGGVFTMLDKAVAAGLTTTSGELNICGNVTFTGNVNITSDTILTFDLGSTLNLDGSTFSFEGGTIYVELGSVNAEGLTTPYFTMGYTEEGSIFFNTATFIQLVQNGVEVGDAMLLQVGTHVTTRLIPEPASATLSLAALMLLCARRRRKN